ncbi:4Fe-4S binding protein [Methylobacterium gossipiicola]|uniref:4Fe-4S binding domain-containing protein n=1 Tax=Methylobacterium gossipiicola TaxID=582675 RepID=A0A1I2WWG3_9HYPH|nr:4Fe-4S binding protein [Methylobacterium gossipiicola]SFH05633.1 4Fe-4S binding domain-containing protein [Methylobacterium gossipiicola]
MAASASITPGEAWVDAKLAAFGDWLQRHGGVIRTIQWIVVAIYLVLVAVPAFLPLPGRTAHLWNDLTVFAQFAFWGIWWPFVLVSMVVVGRAWCGILCPEGALTEFASRWSLGRAVPRWLSWGGWPFVAFAGTTVYGQMVSVYGYPKPVLAVLGGSTLAAIVIGLLYGRNKRVWCRYLCPVNGVFAVLAKLAPISFQVDHAAWAASPKPKGAAFNCAPLVPVKTMNGAGACHMCGRCSGYRGAVRLARRSPTHEIVHVAGNEPSLDQTTLILFGMMGLAVGAFQWSSSPWFIDAKQWLATWLIEHGTSWPLETTLPWFVLTNYPEHNDVLTLLDGVLLLAYIAATALVLGLSLSGLVALGTRALGAWSSRHFHHLTQTLIPVAGCGVFLGLSALTVTFLRGDGINLPYVSELRGGLLLGSSLWSTWLAWRVSGLYAAGLRRAAATLAIAAACGLSVFGWVLLFWIW